MGGHKNSCDTGCVCVCVCMLVLSWSFSVGVLVCWCFRAGVVLQGFCTKIPTSLSKGLIRNHRDLAQVLLRELLIAEILRRESLEHPSSVLTRKALEGCASPPELQRSQGTLHKHRISCRARRDLVQVLMRERS